MVGRAGFEPATLRFLPFRLCAWQAGDVYLLVDVYSRKLYQAELPPDLGIRDVLRDLCISFAGETVSICRRLAFDTRSEGVILLLLQD
jgi:hypothetical protein